MSYSYLIRFKKLGPYRFVAGLDTITMIERTFRRTNLKLTFTEGFHPKPKFSYIDPVSTGIIDLAFYVNINLEEDYDPQVVYNEITAVQPLHLKVDSVTKNFLNLSKIEKYEFLVFVKKPFDFDATKVIEKKTKRGIRQISLDVFENVRKFEKKDYVVINYIIRKENTFNPYLFSDKVFLAIRKEAYIQDNALSLLFERGA